MASMQTVPDPTTIGLIPSFEYTSNIIFPGVLRPTMTGSELGVPPNEAIAGETPVSTNTGNHTDYGNRKAGQAAHSQPIFWSAVLLVVGVYILSHTARISMRG